MPVDVRRLPDEPIIIATLTETIALDDVQIIFQRTEELRADMPSQIYRITDTTDAITSIAEIIRIIKSAADGRSSKTTDPTVTVVFVGKSQWSHLFTEAMKQGEFGKVQIPLFDTLDDALAYVRHLNDDAASAGSNNGRTA